MTAVEKDWKNATVAAGVLGEAAPERLSGREVGKARGILRHTPAPGGEFHHARIAPAVGLAGLVQHFWIVRWDLRGFPPQMRETLPHPNVHVSLAPGELLIYGVQTGRFTRVLADRGGVFGVKFPGGFRPFLRRPVSSLRDRTIQGEG